MSAHPDARPTRDDPDAVAAALGRVRAMLERRPDMGTHDDAPATGALERRDGVTASHANGTTMATDMPAELGGGGATVTPGWLFRAGTASCAATSIALAAAARGIVLAKLEVRVSSRSDTRGLLGMSGEDGAPVHAGPFDLRLAVTIDAPGVDAATLRSLVEEGCRCSPIPSAVSTATPFTLDVTVGG